MQLTCTNDCVDPEWGHYRTIIIFWILVFIAGCFLFLGSMNFFQQHGSDRKEWLETLMWMLRHSNYLIGQLILGLAVCILAFRRIESNDTVIWIFWIEFVIGISITLETFAEGFYACLQNYVKTVYFLSNRWIIDAAILSSIFFRVVNDGRQTWFSLNFFIALRMIYLWKKLTSGVTRYSAMILTTLSIIVQSVIWVFFLGTSMLYFELMSSASPFPFNEDNFNRGNGTVETAVLDFEATTDAELKKLLLKEEWTFIATAYYLVITVSTLGYGDKVPKSIIGQCLGMLTIMMGVAAFGGLISAVIVYLSSPKKTKIYHLRAKNDHIVITGNPSAQMIKDFLNEVYHEDHAASVNYLDTVVLLENSTIAASLEAYLSLKQNIDKFNNRVHVTFGSILNPLDSVHTVTLYAASAVFVFPSLAANDQAQEDLMVVTRVLSIRQQAPTVRIICLLFRYENGEYLSDPLGGGLNKDDVLLLDEFKLSVLGKSCSVFGFSTMLCNLFRSASAIDPYATLDAWDRQYRNGMDRELYILPLSKGYSGDTFKEIFADISQRSEFNVYIIGFAFEGEFDSRSKICLNPVETFQPFLSKPGEVEKKPLGIFISSSIDTIVQKPPEKMKKKIIETDAFHFKQQNAMQPLAGRGEYPNDNDLGNGPVPASLIAKNQRQHKQDVELDEIDHRKFLFQSRIPDKSGVKLNRLKRSLQKVKPTNNRRSEELFRQALNPKTPSADVLIRGQHILLCGFTFDGSALGLFHFITQIRGTKGSEGTEQRSIIVLCPSVPSDWVYVLNFEDIYFLNGDPTCIFDLERASYQNASIIVVLQGGVNSNSDATMADSKPVFTARLIESNLEELKSEKKPKIVTDLLFDKNYIFTPAVNPVCSQAVTRQRNTTINVNALTAGKNAQALLQAAKRPKMTLGLNQVLRGFHQPSRTPSDSPQNNQECDFGFVDDCDATVKPQYACGRLFFASSITSLMVNVMFNQSTVQVIKELLCADLFIFDTLNLEGEPYSTMVEELFERGMIALGILRSMDAAKLRNVEPRIKKKIKENAPFFMYTCPAGLETDIIYGDQIICLVREGDDE